MSRARPRRAAPRRPARAAGGTAPVAVAVAAAAELLQSFQGKWDSLPAEKQQALREAVSAGSA